MKTSLSELGYKTYAYLFDLKYFAKTLKDSGYEEKDITTIVKDAELLYRYILKAIEEENEVDQYDLLSNAYQTAESILNDLKTICCTDKFINEKTDLVVETFAVKEKTEVILNQILKDKED